jgi:hypothetical protein
MRVAVRASLRGTPDQLAFAATLGLDLGTRADWEVKVTREARHGVVERGELQVRLFAKGLDEALSAVRAELDRLHDLAGGGRRLPMIEWRRPRRITD